MPLEEAKITEALQFYKTLQQIGADEKHGKRGAFMGELLFLTTIGKSGTCSLHRTHFRAYSVIC
jgi:hypothetical protein